MTDWAGQISFHPPLGGVATVLLMSAAVAVAVWQYASVAGGGWRRLRLPMSLRLIGLALLGLMLSGPRVRRTEVRDEKAETPVVFLVDTSASMTTRDVPGDGGLESRWEAVRRRWLDERFLSRLRERTASLRVYGFDQALRGMSLDGWAKLPGPAGRETDLWGAVNQVASQLPGRDGNRPGVLVLISDGHQTQPGAVGDVAARVRDTGWTVVGVPVGRVGGGDVTLIGWPKTDLLFEGQSTWIQAVVGRGGMSRGRVRVGLREQGRVVESREVEFDSRSAAWARFRVTPGLAAGAKETVHAYEIVAEPLPEPGAASGGGVSQPVFVRVSGERVRVAVFEGQPCWDTKFLARSLARDPDIELTTVFGVGGGRALTVRHGDDRGRAVDALSEADELSGFDIVVLGRGVERFFGGDRAQRLVDYVTDHGGAVVFSRGQAFDLSIETGRRAQRIVSAIEPVEWGEPAMRKVQLRLPASGSMSPLASVSILQLTAPEGTPGLLFGKWIRALRPAAVVWAYQSEPGQGDAPGVVYQDVGRGRVLTVAVEGMWRWSLRGESGEAFDAFWRQAIHGLASGGQWLPGRSVSLRTEKLMSEPGEAVGVTVESRTGRAKDIKGFQLTMRGPNDQVKEVVLSVVPGEAGRLTGVVWPEEEGVYRLTLQGDEVGEEGLETVLGVYSRSLERRDTSAKSEVLDQLSRATGGGCLEHDKPEELLTMLEDSRATREDSVRFEYVFNHPVLFWGLVAAWGLEWVVRRRRGLV